MCLADLGAAEVQRMTLVQAAAWVVERQLELITEDTARVLCYALYKDQAEELARLLGCDAYHADVPDRALVYRNWLLGRQRVLVGTNAIGAGVDFPGVRLTLHVGAPRNVMAYSQESGRGGRDGELASSVVLLNARARLTTTADHFTNKDQAVMHELLSTQQCRRRVLTSFLDGGSGTACNASTTHQPCDNCCGVTTPIPPAVNVEVMGGEVNAGARLAREASRTEAARRASYVTALEWSLSRCISCYVDRPSKGWQHPPCHRNLGYQLQYEEQRRRIKLPAHVGCFRCVNPEWVCDREGAAGECQWGDHVLRLCHAVILGRTRCTWATEVWGATVPSAAPGWSVARCWDWLAQAGHLFGQPAFNANLVVAAMAGHLVE
jgi:hypothetical protein